MLEALSLAWPPANLWNGASVCCLGPALALWAASSHSSFECNPSSPWLCACSAQDCHSPWLPCIWYICTPICLNCPWSMPSRTMEFEENREKKTWLDLQFFSLFDNNHNKKMNMRGREDFVSKSLWLISCHWRSLWQESDYGRQKCSIPCQEN